MMTGSTPILTITINPSVDVSTGAKQVQTDQKFRCGTPLRDPGGGGLNVARAIQLLGGEAHAFTAVGGHMGQVFLRLLEKQVAQVHPCDIKGETRESMAVIEHETGQQYRFVMPGPQWDTAQVGAALKRINAVAPNDGYVVLSGNNPPGVPDDFPTRQNAQLTTAARA